MNTKQSEVFRAFARNRFEVFVPFAFGEVYPTKRFEPHWSIDMLAHSLVDHLERAPRILVVNMPPRQLKSFVASVAFLVWHLARHPDVRIMCLCGSRGLSRELFNNAAMLIQSTRFRQLFPHMKIRLEGTSIVATHGGVLMYTTFSDRLTGRGANLVHIDDPVPAKYMEDETKLREANAVFDQNILQRLNNESGRISLVMQRLNVADLSGHLLKQYDCKKLILPAMANKDTNFQGRLVQRKHEALNPNRETLDQLFVKLWSVKSRVFMAQYQQEPYEKDKGVRHSGIHYPLKKGVPWKVGDPRPRWWLGQMEQEYIVTRDLFDRDLFPLPSFDRNTTVLEDLLVDGSDAARKRIIARMTPKQRELHGIDPSGEIFPDFSLCEAGYADVHDQDSKLRALYEQLLNNEIERYHVSIGVDPESTTELPDFLFDFG